MGKNNALEAALWSLAIPGFGQIINKKYLKGLTLIGLEILINMRSGLNTIIIYSFHGQTLEAINLTNYQWLMFYPCVYLFAIWDAYRDAGGTKYPCYFYRSLYPLMRGQSESFFLIHLQLITFILDHSG